MRIRNLRLYKGQLTRLALCSSLFLTSQISLGGSSSSVHTALPQSFLKSRRKVIVWPDYSFKNQNLSDVWAVSGLCHYEQGCTGHLQSLFVSHGRHTPVEEILGSGTTRSKGMSLNNSDSSCQMAQITFSW